MTAPENLTSTNFERHVERAAKSASNIKILITALLSAVGVIFAAGVYYSNLSHKLDDYVAKIDYLEKSNNEIKENIANLKNSINSAFSEIVRVQNAGPAFKNTEPRNNGGGFAAEKSPGRCQIGQVVVGVQPYKEGDGTRSIIMQCGNIPIVRVN